MIETTRKRSNSNGNKLGRKAKCQRRNVLHGEKLYKEDLCCSKDLSDNDIIAIISSTAFKNCCNFKNCFTNHFQINDTYLNFEELLKVFRSCRKEFENKTREEKKLFEINKFRETITKSTGKNNRIIHKWTLPPGNISVCASTFRNIYKITKYRFESLSKQLKRDRNVENNNLLHNHVPFKDSTILNYTFNETEMIFQNNLGHADADFIQAALTPKSQIQQDAIAWLDDYGKTFGDQSPNSNDVAINVCTKKEVYDDYVRDMKSFNNPIVSISIFQDIWRTIFQNFKLREWVGIPGHCCTCDEIDTIRKQSLNKAVREAAKQAHLLHRGGFFMAERQTYHRRRLLALQNKEKYLSMVMDGMDQNHSKFPHLPKRDFKAPLKMHVQGILEHGYGLTIFNSFNNVQRGSDLAIYCFLSQIECWQTRHEGKFPEVIFVQIDGGSENANKCFYAMCELLVHKRIASELWITRLPTGHTHEDIDATFGHIWKWMRNRPIETLAEYSEGIKESFQHTMLKISVKFVYVIPSYQSFLKEHIDEFFGLFAKEEHTKHCVHIQAVDFSVAFPLGVKTIYSAYASKKIVEFKKLTPSLCHSVIGRLIGLEPYTVYNKWFPDEASLSYRQGIQGFYILKSIPHLNHSDDFPISKFDSDGIEKVLKCYTAAKNRWPDPESSVRKWWDNWMVTLAPTKTIEEYLETHRLHVPMSFYLRNERVKYFPNWELKSRLISPELDENTTLTGSWPLQIIYSMHSVSSSWCRDPGPSRSLIFSEPKVQSLMNKFQLDSKDFYEILKTKSRDYIFQTIIMKRVDDKGNLLLSKTSSKQDMINALIKDDYELTRSRYRVYANEVQTLLTEKLTFSFNKATDGDKECVHLSNNGNRMILTNNQLRNLNPMTHLSKEIVDFILLQYTQRNQRSCILYDSIHQVQTKRNLYLGSDYFDIIFETSNTRNDILQYDNISIMNYNSTTRNWSVFVLETYSKVIFVYPTSIYTTENLRYYENLLNKHFCLQPKWKCVKTTEVLTLPDYTVPFDSGVFVLMALKYYTLQCPLIITRDDTQDLRWYLCLEILGSEIMN